VLMSKSQRLLSGVVVLYFIIALEVLIMISPFAVFFYAAFNPFLLFLAKWTATRWLADFFLPHMVLPPGPILKSVRIAGSVLFVGGAIVFLVCAGQVYFNKLFRRVPAAGGLYRWIRHPQYVALAATGLGLAILWPRFLTIVLWTVMVGLYYVLARDEERRMVAQFGDVYRTYMARTGMFVPRMFERAAGSVTRPLSPALRAIAGLGLVAFLAVGGAFALRAYTVAKVPLWSSGRVVALAILPGDAMMLEHRLADLLELPEVKDRLAQDPGPVLVYLVPKNYVMQGMIADTDPRFRLYEQHHSLMMISDWIFHPFRHLEGGHMMMHHDMGNDAAHDAPMDATVRRLIFLNVKTAGDTSAPAGLFAINAERTPRFFIDADIHNLQLLDIQDLGPGTGWGLVPTPMF